jgi:hypothetical protein
MAASAMRGVLPATAARGKRQAVNGEPGIRQYSLPLRQRFGATVEGAVAGNLLRQPN